MRATAVLPVKRFAAAKERLGDALAPDERAALALAMLDDVLAALARAERLGRTIVVTGEPAARAAAEEHGAEWIDDPDDSGHSAAAMIGVRATLRSGEAAIAVLPGDCPLLDSAELDRALADLARGSALVVPDRHGTGTNGLLLGPPDAIEPSFGPGSRDRHLDLARRAGVEARVIALSSLALDLDTPDDFRALRERVLAEPDRAPATAEALRGIGPPE